MKKKLKLFTILLVGIFVFQIDTQNIWALKAKATDKGKASATGLLETNNMKVKINDEEYQAYCAFYEKNTPTTEVVTFSEWNDLEDNVAAGLAEIIKNENVKTEYSLTDKEVIAIKTAAINLFLTEKTRTNRFNSDNLTFVNGIFWKSTSLDDMKKNFKKQYDAFHGFSENTCEAFNVSGAINIKNACRNQAATWYLYQKGINADKTVTDAKLEFTNESSKNLTYDSSSETYTGTFIVESNIKLKKDSLGYTIEGVTDKSQVVVSKKMDSDQKGGSITVTIPKSIVEKDIEKVKVKVNAEISYEKSVIYKTVGEEYEGYQDLLIADYKNVPVKISTDKKAISIPKKCYKYSVECENTLCDNKNSSNNRENQRKCKSKTEVYYANSCDEADSDNNGYGKERFKLSDGCHLYCHETAYANYPGSVTNPIFYTGALKWPTNSYDRYSLTTDSTLTCKAVASNGTSEATCDQKAKDATYNYIHDLNNAAKVSYDDTTGNIKNVTLKQNCVTRSSVNGSDVEIYTYCSYSLPENQNVAINKKTVEYVDYYSASSAETGINSLLVDNKGVLPIGGLIWKSGGEFLNNEIFTQKYNLEIEDLPLGYEGQFTNSLNETEFVCKYQITASAKGTCKCPPGSKWSDTDLYGIAKEKAMSCIEAKEIYCNKEDAKYCKRLSDNTDVLLNDCLNTNSQENCEYWYGCRKKCTKPDGTQVEITECLRDTGDEEYCNRSKGCIDDTTEKKECPLGTARAGYEYETDDNYKACIAGGGTETACINLVCECRENCNFYCPPGTDLYPNDISSCVYEQMGAGKSLVDAKAYCEPQCNIDIIYRTISLENPFPSMNADSGTVPTGLVALGNRTIQQLGTEKAFNRNVRGRYPGANWNSVTLVYNKILNNRGYSGSDIYNEAKPLYTINLDPVAIKTIREHNKSQKDDGGYADFEMSCTDGAYCISRFLRDPKFKTADNKHILDSDNSTCANARDKSSFVSCYTTK